MKKIFTLLTFVSSSLLSFAQGPVIEGTYLSVRGSSVKEIWDLTSNITVPDTGQNMLWDYSNEFTNPTDTFQIKTFHPDSVVEGHSFGQQYFPNATHATYLRAPFDNLLDSLYSYYIVDTGGLYMVGARSIKNVPANTDYVAYDTIANMIPRELYVPNIAKYGMHMVDISRYETYGRALGNQIKIKGGNVKDLKGVGYGTLKMPNGNVYTDVLLTKVTSIKHDSVFDPTGTSLFLALEPDTTVGYSFLRNNTFATSALMYLNANTANSAINFGWYTLPVDFGSISGTVYDSDAETNVVKYGEVYLYREHSNFSKDDILARTNLDTLGNFKFDSIPYGEYRIAVRPDLDSFPNAFTTYYGDTTNWLDAPTVITFNDSISDGHKIHLQFHEAPQGPGEISGNLNMDLDIRTNKPIPGVDIIVEKNPGGGAFREVKTDANGNYSIGNLSIGQYRIFVDIPGLYMNGTHEFEIVDSTQIICLNFTSGTDSIHPACLPLSIHENSVVQSHLMQAYPNPYSTSTTIKVDITEKSNVTLEVYNVLGEKITTLDKGMKQAGQYSYTFNAKSLNHANGLYFVKLLVNNKIDVLRIIEQQ
jgi:hypothetical protein